MCIQKNVLPFKNNNLDHRNMAENNDNINRLLEKLELLLKRQDDFSREINQLRIEIHRLKTENAEQTQMSADENPERVEPVTIKEAVVKEEKTAPAYQPVQHRDRPEQTAAPINKPPKEKSDLEKFIGENLISKIGIVITVIGVSIGAKYSIENDLISPLTRIILGYLAGLGLLGIGIRLKSKYENYSAVLVSGAMAIMYFITYAAYSFYSLFPQIMAFMLMIIFTVFTVIAAITYNRQVIAHIGLVGAYTIPFLLSEGSGKVGILFTYMSIINTGILFIAFRKRWKPICYSSFGLTWLIYFSWYLFNYQTSQHFGLALVFLSVFFSIFYLTFLANKLIQKEKLEADDILLILGNSLIFFGIGYNILDNHKTGTELLGLFTLLNGAIHFIVSAVIYKRKLGDRNLLYLISGMVLVFITIAIPVQLDGNWVTLLWAGEAALLFWVGRTRNVPVYEKLSYPLMLLTFFSIVHDWTISYGSYYPEQPETRITPLFNITFLTSILVIGSYSFIAILSRNKKYIAAYASKKGMAAFISFFIPAILLLTVYFAFRLEIANYWNQLYADSGPAFKDENHPYHNYTWNYDLTLFKSIWIINYSLFFFTLLAFVNFRMLKNKLFGILNLSFIALTLTVFLMQGLYVLSSLRESYLDQTPDHYYQTGVFNIGIRYVSLLFVVFTVIACYRYTKEEFMKSTFKITFDFCLHALALWIATSELIHWMDLAESKGSYKLGISILWGIYSLFLIVLGIWKSKKYLRIIAISLFGVTLIKLFFYDIAHLDTIAKTIVFVSLGVLLLIISFLYNKYKNIISNEPGN